MADVDVLKSFLVDLGFKLDDQGLRRFTSTLGTAGKVVRDFALAVTAMATAAEEAIRRTAREFETLYFISQRTGVSVKNIEQWTSAFRAAGMQASDAIGTLTSMAVQLRNMPGLQQLAERFAPGFKDVGEVVRGLTAEYRNLMDIFGETGPAIDQHAKQLRVQIELLGADAESIRQMALNYRAIIEADKHAADTMLAFAVADRDLYARQANAINQQLRYIWQDLEFAFQSFLVQTFPTLETLLKRLERWLTTEGAEAVRRWSADFNRWVSNPKNIDDIIEKLQTIGSVLLSLARGVGELIRLFVSLSETIGPLEAIALTVFGIIAAQALAAAAAVRILGGAIGLVRGALGFGGAAAGAAGASAAGAGAGIAGAVAVGLGWLIGKGRDAGVITGGRGAVWDPAWGPEPPDFKGAKSSGRDTIDDIRDVIGNIIDHFRHAYDKPPAATAPIPEAPGGQGAPSGYFRRSSFVTGGGGDEGSLAEMMMRGFANWWSGSTAFRPIVVVADEFYDKMRNLLFGDVNPAAGGGNAAGTGGGGAGALPGRGRMGRFGGAMRGSESAPGSVPSIAKGNLRNQAIDFFTSRGWSKENAAGIAASLETESSWRANASGDGGAGYGIGQWHPDRQANFKRVFGKDIRQSSLGEQLAFVDWELKNTEAAAGNALRGQTTARGSGSVVSRLYERPLDVAGNASARGSLAEQMLKQYTPGGGGATGGKGGVLDAAVGDSIAVGIKAAGKLIGDAVGGRTPQQIYESLSGHLSDYANKSVAVASGSNPNAGFDANQMGYVRKTVADLRKVGARVVMMGVGSGVKDFGKINRELSRIGEEMNVPFGGELSSTEGGRVHPKDYGAALDQATKAMRNSQPLGAYGTGLKPQTQHIEAPHSVNINVHGTEDPLVTGKVIRDIHQREHAMHMRNLRSALV